MQDLYVFCVFFRSLTDQLPDANTASHVHSFACTLRGTLSQNHRKTEISVELSTKTSAVPAQFVEHSTKNSSKLIQTVRNFEPQTGI